MKDLLELTKEKYRSVSPDWFTSWRAVKPWTDKQVAAFEKMTGVELCDDVRTFFQTCDFAYNFDANYSYEGYDRIRSNWEVMTTLLRDGTFDETWIDRVQDNDGIPQGKISKAYWDPNWIPVGVDGCGNMYCVDHQPGRNGVRGQIIAMESQDGQGPYLSEFSSLTAFLEKHLWYFDNGKVAVDEEGFIEIDRWM